VIRENPYRLALPPLHPPFEKADYIARPLDVPLDGPRRLAAGFTHVLRVAERGGHCALAPETLTRQATRLLGVQREALARGLSELLHQGILASEDVPTPLVYAPALFEAESAVARHIARLRFGRTPWERIDCAQAIPAAAKLTGIPLSPSQREALATVLKHKVSILTGGPGTGKTALTRVLLAILTPHLGEICLAAPIGRAARALKRATQRDAATIHQLLRGGPGCERFGHHAGNPLATQLVIADEMSLVDLRLFRALVEAVPTPAALLLIGDPGQLDSVGAGRVLRDLIASGVIATARLTETHRQGQRSNITYNAARVAEGLAPEHARDRKDDFEWIVENNPRRIPQRVVELAADTLPKPKRFALHPLRDIQILTPRRGGELGAHALNLRLQQALNPAPIRAANFPSSSYRSAWNRHPCSTGPC
jgi:exodeoxyribonuclease V alpha subunit